MVATDTTTSEPDVSGKANGVQAMAAVRFRIPGDVINQAVSELPDDQREALKWFAGYCRARNLGREDMEGLLKKSDGAAYSYDSIYQALTGRRGAAGASLAPLCQAIESFRRIAEAREGQVQSGFIATKLTGRIWETCRKALVRQKMSFIFGPSQIGKTSALEEYQRRHNHGETIYVRMPTGGAMSLFLSELAIALGIPTQQNQAELRRRLIDSFDARMLLIVDEAHQALRSSYSSRGVASLEFVREIYDRSKCGVVICGTDVLREQILRGPWAKILSQLWLRRITPLQLPSRPSLDDLATFAAAFGLPPAPDETVKVKVGRREHSDNPARLQKSVIDADGLGHWVSILQEASDIARDARKSISWSAVIAAHCQFAAMESFDGEVAA